MAWHDMDIGTDGMGLEMSYIYDVMLVSPPYIY